MNSFEEFKNENQEMKKEKKFIFNNEKEIKNNCEIEVKKIPFSYFYKFNN